MKCAASHILIQLGNHWIPWILKAAAILLFTATTSGMNPALCQEDDLQERIDQSRLKDVNNRLNQLKKLRTDLGAGHPKVQETIRDLKLLEEELQFEQTFSERAAAQLQAAEDELRERQKRDWEKSNAIQAEGSKQSESPIPSLDTIEQLERDAFSELQRIDWELAAEETALDTTDQPDAYAVDELRIKAQELTRDAVGLKLKAARDRQSKAVGRSAATDAAAQDMQLAVQLLTLELSIAETQLKAAELELAAKKESLRTQSDTRIKNLKARRAIVEAQLQSMPPKKEIATQVAQLRQSSNQLAEQIREMEMQRFQYQSQYSGQQALLDVVRQALSPQSLSKPAPKSIE